jgi:hypothetical protein
MLPEGESRPFIALGEWSFPCYIVGSGRDSTMTDANHQRLALLREKSRAERGTIAELNGKLGDLKEMLKPALSQLDFVDLYFLDPKILSEDRTPQQLARWLTAADGALVIAINTRTNVERLAKQFGPDARLIHAH